MTARGTKTHSPGKADRPVSVQLEDLRRAHGNGRGAPKAGARRHAAGLPDLASKVIVRVCSAMVHRDPFETLRLPQRALPAAIGVCGQSTSAPSACSTTR